MSFAPPAAAVASKTTIDLSEYKTVEGASREDATHLMLAATDKALKRTLSTPKSARVRTLETQNVLQSNAKKFALWDKFVPYPQINAKSSKYAEDIKASYSNLLDHQKITVEPCAQAFWDLVEFSPYKRARFDKFTLKASDFIGYAEKWKYIPCGGLGSRTFNHMVRALLIGSHGWPKEAATIKGRGPHLGLRLNCAVVMGTLKIDPNPDFVSRYGHPQSLAEKMQNPSTDPPTDPSTDPSTDLSTDLSTDPSTPPLTESSLMSLNISSTESFPIQIPRSLGLKQKESHAEMRAGFVSRVKEPPRAPRWSFRAVPGTDLYSMAIYGGDRYRIENIQYDQISYPQTMQFVAKHLGVPKITNGVVESVEKAMLDGDSIVRPNHTRNSKESIQNIFQDEAIDNPERSEIAMHAVLQVRIIPASVVRFQNKDYTILFWKREDALITHGTRSNDSTTQVLMKSLDSVKVQTGDDDRSDGNEDGSDRNDDGSDGNEEEKLEFSSLVKERAARRKQRKKDPKRKIDRRSKHFKCTRCQKRVTVNKWNRRFALTSLRCRGCLALCRVNARVLTPSDVSTLQVGTSLLDCWWEDPFNEYFLCWIEKIDVTQSALWMQSLIWKSDYVADVDELDDQGIVIESTMPKPPLRLVL
jgi:hypothetical protein